MISNMFSGSSYFNLFIMPIVLKIVFAILANSQPAKGC